MRCTREKDKSRDEVKYVEVKKQKNEPSDEGRDLQDFIQESVYRPCLEVWRQVSHWLCLFLLPFWLDDGLWT